MNNLTTNRTTAGFCHKPQHFLIVFSLAFLSITSTTRGQILTNGGFEDSLAGWTINDTNAVQINDIPTTPSSEGANCVRMGKGGAFFGVLSQSFSVTPGKLFYLSFDFGIDVAIRADLAVRLQVEILNSQSNSIAAQIFTNSNFASPPSYRHVGLVFQAPPTPEPLQVVFTDVSTNGNDTDIMLDGVEIAPYTTPILTNGSFELGLTGWSVNDINSVNIDAVYPSDGFNCVRMGVANITGAVLSQTFSVTPGKLYYATLDFGVDAPTTNESAIVRLEILDNQNNSLAAKTFTNKIFAPVPSYLQPWIRFQAPTNQLQLTITDLTSDIDVNPILDRVMVVPDPGQILFNGSFELGMAGWTINSIDRDAVKLDDIRLPATDGRNCVRMGGRDVPGTTLSQDFRVFPGTIYDLTLDFGAEGTADFEARLGVEISASNAPPIVSQIFTNFTQPMNPSYCPICIRFAAPPLMTNLVLSLSDISPNDGIEVDPIIDHIVIGPAPILRASLANGLAGVYLSGLINASYRLEFVNNVTDTNWQSFGTFELTNNPMFLVDPNFPLDAKRFYRAALQWWR